MNTKTTCTLQSNGYYIFDGTDVEFTIACHDRRAEEIEFEGWVGYGTGHCRYEYFGGSACDFCDWIEANLPELSCWQRVALDLLAYRLIG